jgi:GNAT superfamily N-acetyltransferase
MTTTNRPTPEIQFGKLPTAQLPALNAFYRRQGYKGKAHPEDKIFCVWKDKQIVAAARFRRHHYGWLMRGVWVDKQQQRQGIGSFLLEKSMRLIGNSPCYCFPYPHLIAFYTAAGFRDQTATAPRILCKQLKRYRQRTPGMLLMGRHCP